MPIAIVHSAYVSASGVIVSDSTIYEIEQTANLPYLGAGVSRTVYALDEDHVLKVCNRDVSANLKEREVWERSIGTEVEQWLAPIVAASPSGRWLVMVRGTDNASSFQWDRREELRDCIRTLMTQAGGGDLHNGNIMCFPDGTIRCTDYGYFDMNWGVNRYDSLGSGFSDEYDPEQRLMMSWERHICESCRAEHSGCHRCDRDGREVDLCETPECMIARGVHCEAPSCRILAAGYWNDPTDEVMFCCADHLPNVGPVWGSVTHPAMIWHDDIFGRENVRFGMVPISNRHLL